MTENRLDITELYSTDSLTVARAESPGASGVPILVFASPGNDARVAARREFIGVLGGLNRPMISGHEALSREEARKTEQRVASFGRTAQAAIGRIFGAREILSSASDSRRKE